MKRTITALGLISISLMATQICSAERTSAAQFLKMGAGARALSMGQAFSSVADDVTSAYWNPAGLNNIEVPEIAAMHNSFLLDTQYQYFAGAIPLSNKVIGLSVYRMDYGTIDRYTGENQKDGTFDAGSLAIAGSLATELPSGLKLGGSIKFIQESIESESASAIAADFGLVRQLNRFNLSFSAQNFGTKMKFVQEDENLPLTFRGGVSTKFHDEKLIAAFELSKANDNDLTLHLGGDYNLNKTVSFRGGYKVTPGNNIDVDGLTNLSAGMGFQFNQLFIDYGFLPFGDLGSSHQISLRYRFLNK